MNIRLLFYVPRQSPPPALADKNHRNFNTKIFMIMKSGDKKQRRIAHEKTLRQTFAAIADPPPERANATSFSGKTATPDGKRMRLPSGVE